MASRHARILSALIAAALPLPVFAQAVERLSIVANGATVGSLVAETDGDQINVTYSVSENGRGPRHSEKIRTGPGGLPVSWMVKGSSLMGGAVNERYDWDDNIASWSSQADSGSRPTKTPPLYILNDSSPYADAIYARALLALPGRVIDPLPGGRLKLVELKPMTRGGNDHPVEVRLFRLEGVELLPSYVMLDRDEKLYAAFGSGEVAVRAGYEADAEPLLKLGAALELERVQAISNAVAHDPRRTVRIRNIRIFDPRSGTTGPLATIIIKSDRIVAIQPGDVPAEAGDYVVDGEGGTVFPGLHDMHSHSSLNSGLLNLAAGVTATRDMGNNNALLLDLMKRTASGEIAGPRITPNGFIEGESPYSAHHGFVISSLAEGMDAVRWYKQHGFFEIKFYNSMPPDFIKPLAAEAHRLGLGVTGHVPAFSTPDRVIEEGYDSIAHINQLELGWVLSPNEDTRSALRLTAMTRTAALDLMAPRVRATVDLMKRHGTALDTTAVIVERLMLSRAGEIADWNRDFIDHLPIGYSRYLKRTYVPLGEAGADASYHAAFSKMLSVIDVLHREGIRLLPGTDDPNGFMLQREVELYAMSGMGNGEALKAATLGSATYLKRADDWGVLEPGKYADLVLVAGDPVQEINVIKRPRLVLKGGVIFHPAEIYEAIGIKPFASPPPSHIQPGEKANDDN